MSFTKLWILSSSFLFKRASPPFPLFSFIPVIQRVSLGVSAVLLPSSSAWPGLQLGERGEESKRKYHQGTPRPSASGTTSCLFLFHFGGFPCPPMATALVICDCSHSQGHFLSGREERGKTEGDDLSPLWLIVEASFPGLLAGKQGSLQSCALSCHALLPSSPWVKVRRQ